MPFRVYFTKDTQEERTKKVEKSWTLSHIIC